MPGRSIPRDRKHVIRIPIFKRSHVTFSQKFSTVYLMSVMNRNF